MSPPDPSVRPRRIGYRLLGRAFDYVLHLRPAEWPIMVAHTGVGVLLAAGSGPESVPWRYALAGVLIWVVCLNGGTLAINSAFDRDTDDIAYLRRPPPPPPHLFPCGLGLMTVGLIGALFFPRPYLAAYLICLVMSVAYSTPPIRLKGVPGADWAINMWGFGVLTPFAGWASTGLPMGRASEAVILGFCPLFASFYPLTQLYQLESDRARGDSTLAVVLGVRRSLQVAVGAGCLAFGVFALAGLRTGWGVSGGDVSRWLVLGSAAAIWIGTTSHWLRDSSAMTALEHEQRMYRSLAAWGLTDLAILVCFALSW